MLTAIFQMEVILAGVVAAMLLSASDASAEVILAECRIELGKPGSTVERFDIDLQNLKVNAFDAVVSMSEVNWIDADPKPDDRGCFYATKYSLGRVSLRLDYVTTVTCQGKIEHAVKLTGSCTLSKPEDRKL